ncbi:hypothetical protein CEXT_182061 [Caerostris extrusa]|uniref:C2H2-type domain-containing protein n=1 Tax=Caerostris extrusa TaxID=172846 RepID=A0AAV4Y334_CAEEX|nr:hypothetical protein CEXT_182061 [Caerostris extrusa]
MHVPQKMKKPSYEYSKCPIIFGRKDYLESHERCHNVEKPYVCKFCDKAFTQSGHLGIYIRTHTGEKPHSCTNCSKNFVSSGDLKNMSAASTLTKNRIHVINAVNVLLTVAI